MSKWNLGMHKSGRQAIYEIFEIIGRKHMWRVGFAFYDIVFGFQENFISMTIKVKQDTNCRVKLSSSRRVRIIISIGLLVSKRHYSEPLPVFIFYK